MKHLWGLAIQRNGQRFIIGGQQPLACGVVRAHGCWEWEINASYNKKHAHTALFWPEWYKCDPSLDEDGSRSAPFPGWEGNHPWLRASQPQTAYESHYYYCPTYRGKGKNKRLHRESGVCYVRDLKWEMRENSGNLPLERSDK